jgi:hypothetical protein
VSKAQPPIPEDFQKALGIALPPPALEPAPPSDVPFTTLATIEGAVQHRIAAIDPQGIAAQIIQARLDLMRGKI